MKRLSIICILLIMIPLVAFNQNEGKQEKLPRQFPEYSPIYKSGFAAVYRGEYLKLDYSRFFPFIGDYNNCINELTGSSQYELGFQIRYVFKLSQEPLVYSRHTRLDQVPSLGVDHISLGLSVSMNFDFE